MPFVSDAQRRKFYATPSLRKYIPEFEAATPKGAKLPARLHPHRKRKTRRGQSTPLTRHLAMKGGPR